MALICVKLTLKPASHHRVHPRTLSILSKYFIRWIQHWEFWGFPACDFVEWLLGFLMLRLGLWACGGHQRREGAFLLHHVKYSYITDSSFLFSFPAFRECLNLELWFPLFAKPAKGEWGLPYYIILTLALLPSLLSNYKNLRDFFGPHR